MEETHDAFGVVGQVIDGRYRVDGVVGEGGFGIVYKGWHLSFKRPVAVKILKAPAHFTSQARARFVEKFREEGELLSSLSDAPNVVRVYDFGVTPTSGGQAPYLVLEWLEGHGLDALMIDRHRRALGPWPLAEAVELLAPAIEGVAYAHQLRVVHRDIKPPNLFLARTARGATMKVLDFGIGKAMQEGESVTFASTGTASGFHAFSPSYGAPEQFFSKRYGATGPWTDVHALALVLVEMITGRPALDGEEHAELLMAATSTTRPTPRARGASVSDVVETVFQKALASNPSDRYQDAGALLDALRKAAAGIGGTVKLQLTLPGEPLSPLYAAPTAQPPTAQPAPLGPTLPPATPPQPAQTAMTAGWTPRDVIPAPPATMVRRRRGKSALPWAIGGGVLVAAIGVTAVVMQREPAEIEEADAPAATAAVAPDKIELARDVVEGKEHYAIAPLPEADAKGKWHTRITSKAGVAVHLERINPAGKVVAETTIDVGDDGVRTLKTRDGYGTQVETVVVTTDGIATRTARSGEVTQNGCYRVRRVYGKRGDVVEEQCLSHGGGPMVDADGCAVRRYTHDERHLVRTRACFAFEGSNEEPTPATDAQGVHVESREHDPNGNVAIVRFFDKAGAPVGQLAEGCFGYQYGYDAAGNRTRLQCIETSGAARALTGMTVAAALTEPDANGCTTRTTYGDVAGKPSTFGAFAEQRMQVTPFCNELRHEWRDAAGKLVLGDQQVAIVAYELDSKGNTMTQSCFGTDEKPMGCSGAPGSAGSVVRFEHDERGRLIRERAFAADGKPTARNASYPHEIRYAYGADGRQESSTFYDAAGKPATALGGAARTSLRYDESGGIVSQTYFGTDDQPIVASIGCHVLALSYDDRHRLAAIECRGLKAELLAAALVYRQISWPAGAAKVVVERDAGVFNVFSGPSGTVVKRVDCARPTEPCYR
jgi:serine/threonine protein kinase